MPSSQDRFARQQGLVPQSRLQETQASVIGVGAIGRQVALQLTAMGVRRLQLIDHDAVELVNVTTQGYLTSDVGLLKVQATAATVELIDSGIVVDDIVDRYRPRHLLGTAVFCCVDSMISRLASTATGVFPGIRWAQRTPEKRRPCSTMWRGRISESWREFSW